jgi:hypothetical protein
VAGFTTRLFTSRGRSSQYLLDRRLERLHILSGRLEEEKSFLLGLRIEAKFHVPPILTIVPTPTELLWVLLINKP